MDNEKERFIFIFARKQGQAEMYARDHRLKPNQWKYIFRVENTRGRDYILAILLPGFYINVEGHRAYLELKNCGHDVIFKEDDF